MAQETAFSVLDRNRPLTMLDIINRGTSEDETIGQGLNQASTLVQANIQRETALLQAHAARHASIN